MNFFESVFECILGGVGLGGREVEGLEYPSELLLCAHLVHG